MDKNRVMLALTEKALLLEKDKVLYEMFPEMGFYCTDFLPCIPVTHDALKGIAEALDMEIEFDEKTDWVRGSINVEIGGHKFEVYELYSKEGEAL